MVNIIERRNELLADWVRTELGRDDKTFTSNLCKSFNADFAMNATNHAINQVIEQLKKMGMIFQLEELIDLLAHFERQALAETSVEHPLGKHYHEA